MTENSHTEELQRVLDMIIYTQTPDNDYFLCNILQTPEKNLFISIFKPEHETRNAWLNHGLDIDEDILNEEDHIVSCNQHRIFILQLMIEMVKSQ